MPKSEDHEATSPLIAVRTVNEKVPSESVKFISEIIPNLNMYKCIGIGLAFKGVPETNDFRNSPSIDFLISLTEILSSIKVWDNTITNADSSLEFPFDSELDTYNFYAILNNNPKNVDFFSKKVLSSNTDAIIVFYHWRMIKPNQIIYSNKVQLVHYFSLSHYEKFII